MFMVLVNAPRSTIFPAHPLAAGAGSYGQASLLVVLHHLGRSGAGRVGVAISGP
jgi:hypothetical protein